MRLAVWPVDPARALGAALLGAGVTEVVELEPHEARAALRAGTVDLALVPTLDVLRDADGLDLLPGLSLTGERSPRRTLGVAVALDAIETIGFDPHDAQEALLTQLVLREHYGTAPVFRLVAPGTSAADALAANGTALLPLGTALPDGAFEIDPALEWLELTLRPYVWGLVATLEDGVSPEQALALRDAVAAFEPTDALRADGVAVYQLSLDGYAVDGLAETAEHLFATGTLAEIPELVFLELPPDPDADDAPAEGLSPEGAAAALGLPADVLSEDAPRGDGADGPPPPFADEARDG